MTFVEERYNQAINQMTGIERLQRVAELHSGIYQMTRFQLQKQYPEIDERQLQMRVAERIYFAEPAVVALLGKAGLR